MITRVVSLGDSFSCGEGVGVRIALRRTWVGLLADGLAGGCLRPLAAPGSVVSDVRVRQLPLALSAAPRLATLLIGLNDVIRAGFNAARVRADLRTVVVELRAGGAAVLVARLHDPTAQLPLPGSLRRAVYDRIAVINAAVDDASRDDPGVHVLDLGAVPALRGRTAWAVDRLHPSLLGHFAMATAALNLLDQVGLAAAPPVGPAPKVAALGSGDEVRWLVRHGLPWFAAHGRPVALPAAGMALRRARLAVSGC